MIRVAIAFDDYGMDYAIGGALAHSLWGIPRATLDVDIDVFTESDNLEPVLGALTHRVPGSRLN